MHAINVTLVYSLNYLFNITITVFGAIGPMLSKLDLEIVEH